MKKFFRKFIETNYELSSWINSMLPSALRADGNKTFLADFAPYAAFNHAVVYDVGGGSRPFHSITDKQSFNLTIVGLDISADELASAPEGIYDKKIATDLCEYRGQADADVVICQATLEHVRNTAGAIRGLSSILKEGGRLFLFVPCRNALFARVNVILPERLKRHILFTLFPSKATGHDGFKAFYNACTPSEIEQLAASNGFEMEERRLFWNSSYFFIFTPAYFVWRVYQGLSYFILREDAAETFIYVLRKNTRAGH